MLSRRVDPELLRLQALPYRWIGFVRCADGTRCTGALVSDRHVLTAGVHTLQQAHTMSLPLPQRCKSLQRGHQIAACFARQPADWGVCWAVVQGTVYLIIGAHISCGTRTLASGLPSTTTSRRSRRHR